jgi:hypothetical protein
MPLASIYAQSFANKNALDKWLFNHAQDHYAIVQKLRKKGIAAEQLPLYPVNGSDFVAWNLAHATMHLEMNSALGLSSRNMLTVSFGVPSQLTLFLNYNYLEHYAAEQALS